MKTIALLVLTATLALAATANITYVASKKSKIYHRTDCRSEKLITEDNRVEFATKAAAEQAGFTLCKACAHKETK